MKNLLNIIIILFVILASSCNNSTKKEIKLAQYLEQSEIQYETDEQRHNIINALNDILTLSIEELKNKKYPNCTGEENQWDLPTLINKYFVPAYQQRSIQDYYIKFCRSKITKKDLENKLSNIEGEIKIVELEVKFRNGTWDICDTILSQSRIGPYVIIHRIIN